jgi:hypothetical protein
MDAGVVRTKRMQGADDAAESSVPMDEGALEDASIARLMHKDPASVSCTLCRVNLEFVPLTDTISLVELAQLKGAVEKDYATMRFCSPECAVNMPFEREVPQIASAIRARVHDRLGRVILRNENLASCNVGNALCPTTRRILPTKQLRQSLAAQDVCGAQRIRPRQTGAP